MKSFKLPWEQNGKYLVASYLVNFKNENNIIEFIDLKIEKARYGESRKGLWSSFFAYLVHFLDFY